jgi:hypothetical protein
MAILRGDGPSPRSCATNTLLLAALAGAPEPPALQGAFVFAKPHANTPEMIALIKDKFAEVGVTIEREGDITGEAIDAKGYIDRHYYAIASKATILQPHELNVPAEKFAEAFGEEWSDVLADGRAFNAMGVQARLGVSAERLDELWIEAKADGRLVKLGGGFYCALLDKKERVYTFNAFFMGMRGARSNPSSVPPEPYRAAHPAPPPLSMDMDSRSLPPAVTSPRLAGRFTAPGSSVHYFVVSFDPARLPWSHFRGQVLGPTDPASAPEGSLRGLLHARWEALGLAGAPNTGDNGVHASASPFEALAERVNWLEGSIADDPFGRHAPRPEPPKIPPRPVL